MRSYGEYCAIAKSLDVVGDRWTLLIVRELALRGPSRYTDVRAGLPGIATNLLADRLRELEEAGVVAREQAPPPVATTLFRLTPRGEELGPVLATLLQWGTPLMAEQKPDDVVQSHWLAGALGQLLIDRRPDGPPVTVEVRTGDRPIVIDVRQGTVSTTLGPAVDAGTVGTRPAVEADLVLAGPAKSVLELLHGRVDRTQAEADGVTIEGDGAILERIGTAGASAAEPDRLQSSVPRS